MLEQDIPIKAAVRFQRRNPDIKVEFIPPMSIKVDFKGKALHKKVKFNFCNLPVKSNALRAGYGHVSAFFEAKKNSCLNCGKSSKCKNCKTMKCLSSGSGEHIALNKWYPNRERELNIDKIMAVKNLSYKEVKKNFSSNYFNDVTTLIEI